MPAPEESLDLLTAAKILGVHHETARRYLAEGIIPARKTRGARGHWRVSPKALDAYLNTPYDPRTGR